MLGAFDGGVHDAQTSDNLRHVSVLLCHARGDSRVVYGTGRAGRLECAGSCFCCTRCGAVVCPRRGKRRRKMVCLSGLLLSRRVGIGTVRRGGVYFMGTAYPRFCRLCGGDRRNLFGLCLGGRYESYFWIPEKDICRVRPAIILYIALWLAVCWCVICGFTPTKGPFVQKRVYAVCDAKEQGLFITNAPILWASGQSAGVYLAE